MKTIEEAALSGAGRIFRCLALEQSAGAVLTDEEVAALRAAAARLSRAQWARLTPEERSVRMSAAGKLGGRPRDLKRCYCGHRNWHSATIRRFDCCKRAGLYPAGVPMPPVEAPRKKEAAR